MEFANFEPELFTQVADNERPAPAFHGVVKSAGTGKEMFDEIANNVLFSVIDSFFQPNDNGFDRLFYEEVSVGFGIMGMAGVDYLVCMEVVGRAFISPCSKPLFIGGNDHHEAINNLQNGQTDTQ